MENEVLDLGKAFDWCDLSTDKLVQIGADSFLGRIGLQIGQWLGSHMIVILAALGLFMIGIVFVGFMLGRVDREHARQRLIRMAAGLMMLVLISTGSIFLLVDRVASVVDGAEYATLDELIEKYNGDTEKAWQEFSRLSPSERADLCNKEK